MAATVTGADGSRWYIWPSLDRTSNERFHSVTTIIGGGIPKEALKWWAAKATAEYAVDNLPAIREILARSEQRKVEPIKVAAVRKLLKGREEISERELQNLIEEATTYIHDEDLQEEVRDDAIDLVKRAHLRTTKRAALKGSDLHKAIEAYMLEKPYPGVGRRAQAMYDQFLRFLEEFRPEVQHTEAKVFSREYRYAGRLDAMSRFPSIEGNPLILWDIKTGSGVYPEAALQMAAYSRTEFIAGPEGTEFPMLSVDGAAVLHLSDDDYRFLPVSITDEVFDAFLFAREVYRWGRETSKGVIGKPLVPVPPKGEKAKLRSVG